MITVLSIVYKQALMRQTGRRAYRQVDRRVDRHRQAGRQAGVETVCFKYPVFIITLSEIVYFSLLSVGP